SESFTNLNASGSSYSSGSFVGDNATWTYNGARKVTSTDNITGTTIGFTSSGTRNVSASTDLNGVGDLTYSVSSYFTGGTAANRTIEVYVNGTLYDDYTLEAEGPNYTRTISANEIGSVLIEFRSVGTRQIVIDDVSWTAASSSSPTISFDSSTSIENETDATFTSSNIPITVSNYSGTPIDLNVSISGGTAESGDYTYTTQSLSFTADETQNITVDINDDADIDNETIIFTITETSSVTGLIISQATHTLTITDDDLPQLIISEIMYNTPGTDDEWIEIYNGDGGSVDISDWIIEYNSSTVFTFPGSTSIADGDYITIALGSNGDGTFNNENSFTPDYSSVADPIADTEDTNNMGNSDGTITLKNNGGSTIDEVAYDDGDASSTDGDGPSYEIMNLTLDNSATSSNWQASSFDGGSPKNSVQISNDETLNSDISFDINIGGSGSLTLNSNASINGDVVINDGGELTLNGTGTVSGNATITDGGSLIARDGAISGTVTYIRSVPTTNWYLISSPVSGQDIDAFVTASNLATGTQANNVGFSNYNNTLESWTYYQSGASGTGNFNVGQGHAVKLSASGSVSFTGNFNDTNEGLSLTNNTNGFNLIGNPYTSYISVSELIEEDNVATGNEALLSQQTIWLWDQSANTGAGGYVPKNLAADLEIAPGQGFFVLTGSAGTFDITEAMQSHNTDTFFTPSSNRPEINLTLTNESETRATDIYYIDGTTTGFDNGYDSSIFGGFENEFAMYTHEVTTDSGRNLGIQSLPDNDYENMIIPVGINATSGMTISISASSVNLPDGIKLYLQDTSDNSFTLLENDSKFTTTLTSDLNGSGRFY
ncbi:lamin tail domain-containing protein, partial [Flavobacteriaceae bacterium]|nr:lamin tail domain-containing protein [Flavobacteriaceae bacterium]